MLIPPPASPERLLLIVLFSTFSVQGVLKSGFSIVMAPPAACEMLPEMFMFWRVRLALKLSRMAPPDYVRGIIARARVAVAVGEVRRERVAVGDREALHRHGELRRGVVGVEVEVGIDVEDAVQAAAADGDGASARVGDRQVAAAGEDVEVAGLVLVLAHPSHVRDADLVDSRSHQVDDVASRVAVGERDGRPQTRGAEPLRRGGHEPALPGPSASPVTMIVAGTQRSSMSSIEGRDERRRARDPVARFAMVPRWKSDDANTRILPM